MIKTQTKEENKFMRKILPHYFQYISANPHTFLVRIVDMHRVKMYHLRRKVHFVIMTSVFDTIEKIDTIYDLKGSMIGRRVNDVDRNKGSVLKDQNLIEDGMKLKLGSKKAAFMEQLKKDSEFLASLNIMDYSLLVGIHYRDRREKTIISGSHIGVSLGHIDQTETDVGATQSQTDALTDSLSTLRGTDVTNELVGKVVQQPHSNTPFRRSVTNRNSVINKSALNSNNNPIKSTNIDANGSDVEAIDLSNIYFSQNDESQLSVNSSPEYVRDRRRTISKDMSLSLTQVLASTNTPKGGLNDKQRRNTVCLDSPVTSNENDIVDMTAAINKKRLSRRPSRTQSSLAHSKVPDIEANIRPMSVEITSVASPSSVESETKLEQSPAAVVPDDAKYFDFIAKNESDAFVESSNQLACDEIQEFYNDAEVYLQYEYDEDDDNDFEEHNDEGDSILDDNNHLNSIDPSTLVHPVSLIDRKSILTTGKPTLIEEILRPNLSNSTSSSKKSSPLLLGPNFVFSPDITRIHPWTKRQDNGINSRITSSINSEMIHEERGNEIYYVGIIDILQQYNTNKRAENFFKVIYLFKYEMHLSLLY